MITVDKIATYGNKISNYFVPGAHPDTYAIKNVNYSLTKGVDQRVIAGLLGVLEN